MKFIKKQIDPTLQTKETTKSLPYPTILQLFYCILHFLLSIILNFIPFVMYFMLTGSSGREGSTVQRIFGICISVFPIFITLKVVLFCSKKMKLTEQYLHLNTLRSLHFVLFFILLANSYTCFFPSNPLTAVYRICTGTQDYFTQEKETKKNITVIEHKTPFFTSKNDWETEISLFYLEEKLYVQRKDKEGNHCILEIKPYNQAYFSVTKEGIYLLNHKQQKSQEKETLLDLMFLQQEGLEDGRDVYYYSNAERNNANKRQPTHMLLQIEGENLYYNLDEFGIFTHPEDIPYGSSSSYYAIRYDIFNFLSQSLPLHPWDSQNIIYGHVPFYQLEPSETFSFPNLMFQPVDSRVTAEVDSCVAVNFTDKEGNPYLSSWKFITEEETQSLFLYADLDLIFSNFTVEEVYIHLTVNLLEQTVCSNVFSISREQYERYDW